MMIRYFFIIAGLIVLLAGVVDYRAQRPAYSTEKLWKMIKQGDVIVFVRHGRAPGVADPPNMTLSDCSTQRQMDDVGRDNARLLGKEFQKHGVHAGDVEIFTSPWCRAKETATLMNLGTPEVWTGFNSVLADSPLTQPYDWPERMAKIFDYINGLGPTFKTQVFVTHKPNIRFFCGFEPDSGEMVVMRPTGENRLELLGRIGPFYPPDAKTRMKTKA